MWATEGDVLAQLSSTAGSGYATRQTKTDSYSIGWVLSGSSSGTWGSNSSQKANVKPTAEDLPVVKGVTSSATTSTQYHYFYYTTTALSNVGSVEFTFGNSYDTSTSCNVYLVMGDAKSASGGDAYTQVELSNSSTTKQGASISGAGTYTFTFASTQTSAKYYGLVIKVANSAYKRFASASLTLKEGSTAPTTYTVTYDANGGTGTMTDASSPYTSGATVTTKTNTFTKDGYDFDHWNTAADNSGTTYAEGATFTISANTTLYAQWVESSGTPTYTLTITEPTGGTITVLDGNADEVSSGSKHEEGAELTIEAIASTGYTFSAWTGTTSAYASTSSANTTFTMPASAATIGATFTLNTHSLSLTSSNGTCATTVNGETWDGSSKIPYGAAVVVTATPNSGYQFSSWTCSYNTVSTNGNEISFTMPDADVTLTANYSAIPTHTATFSVNGVTSSQVYAEGAAITFPSNPGDIMGKKFVGWYTAEYTHASTAPSPLVTSATMSTSDVTFYAVFADVTGTTEASWTETAIGSISSSDVVVISNGSYAMNNDGGTTDAPTVNSISVSGTSLSSAPADKLKWNVSGNATDGYTFYPNGTTSTWLYCSTTASSSSNNNIRVGTGDRKVWKFDNSGYLVTKDNYTDRYLSIYVDNSTPKDFRGYTSTSNGAFVPKFYKYTAGSTTYANYSTSVVVTYTVTYDANGATSGTVPTDDNEYAEDDEVTVLGNTGSLAKTGYTFAGWNTQADGNGTNYTAGTGTFNITDDVTLYAKWNAKTITGLSYTGTPTKTTYNAGDSFDPTGLTVSVNYSDESSDDVTASVTWTPDPLTKGTTSVTGTYMEKTVNVTGLTVKGPAGSITVTADDPVNVVYGVGSDDLALTYENITISEASDFDVQFYDANDEEISSPAWIEVSVEAAEPSGYKVSYTVSANTVTTARSAYFKVYALDENDDLAYSDKITITQAAKPVTAPTIGLAAGLYTTTQSVTITTNEAGGTTYYTTDGEDPTNESTEYTGAISISETTTLKAITYVGGNYSSIASATYTIFALEDGVFDFVKAGAAGYDYGSGVEKTNSSSTYVTDSKTWTAGNVTMVTAKVSGNGYRWWSNDNTLRFYSGSNATFSVPNDYKISKIVTTGANFDSADKGDLSSDTWTGLENEVKLSVTNTRNIKTITVTYVPKEISVTVTASGYLSYCSPYKLDFTYTTVKAYKASVNETTGQVTLTQVDIVPAEEGVILFSTEAKEAGTEKTYTIPVTAAAASDVTGNQMVGVLERTQVFWNPSENVYNYILQQGQFNKATESGGYLKANRAYLSTSYDVTATGARPLTIVFEDSETTGISLTPNPSPNSEGSVYDLQGRKVTNPGRGLYIVNGKKIMVK